MYPLTKQSRETGDSLPKLLSRRILRRHLHWRNRDLARLPLHMPESAAKTRIPQNRFSLVPKQEFGNEGTAVPKGRNRLRLFVSFTPLPFTPLYSLPLLPLVVEVLGSAVAAGSLAGGETRASPSSGVASQTFTVPS